jgi:hypothetical protein
MNMLPNLTQQYGDNVSVSVLQPQLRTSRPAVGRWLVSLVSLLCLRRKNLFGVL